MEGYIKEGSTYTPVLSWWEAQIEEAEKEKKDRLFETRWDTWDEWYEGNFPEGMYIKNIFFMMERSLIPRLYLQNPTVTLTSKRKDAEHEAYAKLFANLDNRVIDLSRFKEELKKAVQITFRNGACAIQIGFGSDIGGLALEEEENEDEEKYTKNGFSYDIHQDAKNDLPWIKAIHPRDFGLAAGCRRLQDSFYSYQFITKALDDLVNDDRIDTDELEAAAFEPGKYSDHPAETIDLLEIRDRRFKKVMLFAPEYTTKPLVYADDVLQSQYGLPFELLVFNPSTKSVWGTPDSKILESFQNETLDVKRQISKSARSVGMKVLSEIGNISAPEKAKMTNTDSDPVVDVKRIGKIKLFPTGTIPDELQGYADDIMQDTRETVGFSRNAMGAFEPGSRDITATEVNTVKEGGEIRIDERRDMLFDLLKRVFRHVHVAMDQFLEPNDIIELLGDIAKEVFEEYQNSTIDASFFDVEIHPESAAPETAETLERRAISIYQLFAENPLIDQEKLLTRTLTKLKGLSPEELMIVQEEGKIPTPSPLTPENLQPQQ